MVERSGEFSFFWDIHVTNGWNLQFPKVYRHKNGAAGIYRGVKSLETNQTSTGDNIMFRRDFKKNVITTFKQRLWSKISESKVGKRHQLGSD